MYSNKLLEAGLKSCFKDCEISKDTKDFCRSRITRDELVCPAVGSFSWGVAESPEYYPPGDWLIRRASGYERVNDLFAYKSPLQLVDAGSCTPVKIRKKGTLNAFLYFSYIPFCT